MARTAGQDKVRELQRTLYRAAKADPGRRFHALYDKVYGRDVLERAWELVRANRGAAGVDRQTIAAVEEYGVAELLDELAANLKQKRAAATGRRPSRAPGRAPGPARRRPVAPADRPDRHVRLRPGDAASSVKTPGCASGRRWPAGRSANSRRRIVDRATTSVSWASSWCPPARAALRHLAQHDEFIVAAACPSGAPRSAPRDAGSSSATAAAIACRNASDPDSPTASGARDVQGATAIAALIRRYQRAPRGPGAGAAPARPTPIGNSASIRRRPGWWPRNYDCTIGNRSLHLRGTRQPASARGVISLSP
jgi:hypothetical protein